MSVLNTTTISNIALLCKPGNYWPVSYYVLEKKRKNWLERMLNISNITVCVLRSYCTYVVGWFDRYLCWSKRQLYNALSQNYSPNKSERDVRNAVTFYALQRFPWGCTKLVHLEEFEIVLPFIISSGLKRFPSLFVWCRFMYIFQFFRHFDEIFVHKHALDRIIFKTTSTITRYFEIVILSKKKTRNFQHIGGEHYYIPLTYRL